MRPAAIVVALVACGPGIARGPISAIRDSGVDALTTASQSGDAAAIEHLFGETVGLGGIWFADPSCRAAFSAAGVLAPAARNQLAHCLAGLKLAKSGRTHTFDQTALVTYDPGIELEVSFARKQPQSPELEIRWIGYASRSNAADALPTVVPRLLGEQPAWTDDTRGKLASALAAAEPDVWGKHPSQVVTWVKLCVDATGAVTSATPRMTTSVPASAAFVDAAKTWRLQPVALGPVCSVIQLGYPDPDTAARMPPLLPERYEGRTVFPPVARQLVSGDKNIVPDDMAKVWMTQHGIQEVDAWLLVCLIETGTVDSVAVLRSSGLPRYDERLAHEIQKWRFRPLPVRACSYVKFIYSQR